MYKLIEKDKQAIESFFKRGWGIVEYDENGLHFLEPNFESGLINVRKDKKVD